LKAAVILGTRPEIIKMSPVIRELENQGLDYFILHTGQHYSYKMDRVFFEQLHLPKSKYNLNVGSGTHAEETGRILMGIEQVLHEEKPTVVLVQGDTNTVLGGALAASKLMIKLAHVEAGLRSYDREMPEEINRLLTDHISDYLFAPTENSRANLLKEGIDDSNIFVTGNTIVDALLQNIKLVEVDDASSDYLLLTLHRQENVDRKDRLRNIVKGLELVAKEFEAPIICPLHPRTKKRIAEFNISYSDKIKFVDPVNYLEFLKLLRNARLVFTDSGGVQEEACILRVPCVTLRDNTERPETIEVGSNILASAEPKNILENAKIITSKTRDWQNPFGDGRSGERIVQILRDKMKF
jgi:UDP-N-acetylglucosamine 2-epimerase (non-hydrolysing)